MKRKRYRKNELVGEFLSFQREVFPLITNSGKVKNRRAFFQCVNHPNSYYKITIKGAKEKSRSVCLCSSVFNEEFIHKVYSKKEVEEYLYTEAQNWHSNALSKTPAGWLWVSRIGIFLKKEDGTNMLFYKFQKSNRTGADYRAARRIEDITWNRPKENKAFYLMRLSYEYDRLHREGLIEFKSDLWNRGAGMEIFDNILSNETT